jgi:formylglycine-generating enzyme required for sulfatase activity
MAKMGNGENERDPDRDAGGGVMPMTTESHIVRCGQCHRTRAVAVSNLHPPCFRNVEEQADCPEILQRRGSGDETLLTMMCGALAGSLAENLERAAVEAVEREGVWQVACRIPGEPDRYYSSGQAQGQAEIWDRCGRALLASRFRGAANEASRKASRSRRRTGRLAPIMALSVVAAMLGAAWFLLMRQPTVVAMQSPALAAEQQSASAVAETPSAAAPPRRLLAATQPSSQPAAPETAAPPSPEAVPSTPQTVSMPLAPSEPQAPSTPQAPSIPTAKELASAASAAIEVSLKSKAAPPSEPIAEPEMVSLPGGTFAMGSNLDPSEAPVHTVLIKPFAISKAVVTVRAWSQCVAAKACPFVATDENDDAPVTNVSFNDAQQFISWLAQATQRSYRLPTEAEWEYAARGGTRTKYWWGDDIEPGMINCKGCNGDQNVRQTAKAEDIKPNPFGLYDMGGNVAQWVSDCWHKNYQGAVADGSAWVEPDYCIFHVIRSGSWRNAPSYVRPASRDYYDGRIRYPTHGFRIARSR